MDTLIKAKGLFKTYLMGEVTVEALKDVDFELYAGEFVVILGPSGSGKSTLLNIVGGMDEATSGELYFKDTALHNANEKKLTNYRRNDVGFVFQFYNLIPNLTTYENVSLAAEISPDSLSIEDVLEKVELLDRAKHFPSQLSGGQQQRVALARAMVKNPKLLLCDEPTGALDVETGILVLKLLKDFCASFGKTVVIITHNAAISQMADRVFYIKDGQISSIKSNENPLPAEKVTW
ncbi:MAG: ABC transporter ATP-binding protein [Firmicutes bacterium]|nr:ABC transporter ATP-binding protein [Bacillota bacterium]